MEWRSEQFPVFCLAKSSCAGFSLLREWGTAANGREHCFGDPALIALLPVSVIRLQQQVGASTNLFCSSWRRGVIGRVCYWGKLPYVTVMGSSIAIVTGCLMDEVGFV